MAGLSSRNLFSVVCIASLATLAVPGDAATVELDGTNITTLSAAVTAAYADSEPAVVNVTASSLTVADSEQIILDQPITINGDFNNDGPCDVLVDTASIGNASTTNVGKNFKHYIEVFADGVVNISDLRIHPNSDGNFGPNAQDDLLVGALKVARPTTGIGTYTFTRLEVSGSDSSDAFVDLATGDDLYNMEGVKKWGGHSSQNDQRFRARGTVQVEDYDGTGVANTIFDHCKFGLTYSAAFNLNMDAGTHQILGGVFGHSARDAIHVQGTGVTIKGTHDDRVRVVRSTNIAAANSHGIEAFNGADIDLIEYVDIAGVNTANCLSIQNGAHIAMIRYVRAMGKFTKDTNNHCVYITGDTCDVDAIENCTFHGNSLGNLGLIAMDIRPNVTNPIAVKDSIFTSENDGTNFGFVNVGPTDPAALPTFENCALPSDSLLGESLGTPPIAADPSVTIDTSTCINTSPHYALTLDDYDWSDNQGAGQPGNAAGNANVYRPTDTAYETAGSGGTPLYGAAGEPGAGIAISEWMLM